jgi:hypothetical protein
MVGFIIIIIIIIIIIVSCTRKTFDRLITEDGYTILGTAHITRKALQCEA